MDRETRSDGYTAIEDRFAGYEVYDPAGEKIGKVDDLFVDQADEPEYIGVKMGFLGTRSTLIPWELVSSSSDEESTIFVDVDKDRAKNSPTFDDDREITPEFEQEVHAYYGLDRTDTTEDRGSYGDYYGETPGGAGNGTAGPGMTIGDREGGEFHEHSPAAEGVAGEGREDLEDEDELRVQRSEEELRAGTREREAGSLKVRKRVRTDREQIEVPTRHEEVSVERVPASGEATETEIGEEEVVVPVTEEEVVVDKRAVAKEEVRIRKDAVEDTEVVEEDVRREEVEVEDDTERRSI
jgi:uncharacterized protein (TIGR02271 family)